MDAKGFDRLAKTLSGSANRRRLLAGFVGAALTGVVSQPGAADDTPKPNGKKCTKGAQCHSGHCCQGSGRKQGTCRDCCGDADCGVCNTCVNNECQAEPNLSFACDGSQLRQICCGNPLACTDTEEIGVCVDGDCSCGAEDYDPDSNR